MFPLNHKSCGLKYFLDGIIPLYANKNFIMPNDNITKHSKVSWPLTRIYTWAFSKNSPCYPFLSSHKDTS